MGPAQVVPYGLGHPVGWEEGRIRGFKRTQILHDAEKGIRIHQPFGSQKSKHQIESRDQENDQEHNHVSRPLRRENMNEDHGEKNTDARRDNGHGQAHVQDGEVITRAWPIHIGIGHHDGEAKDDDHP